ncbi:4-coumarate--CoA ligase 1-like [Bradysia coprophila]|uniref:4-coumarate--CoA ligase 1-like n=1 Tax=Bradysia coprophila TaxID=38358 RepID=UPI00187DAE48|nr:4-coumarate--CoA ligase 1-like [Bradysia coprophila]
MEQMLKMLQSTYDEENKLWKAFEAPVSHQNVYVGEKIIENLRKSPNKLLQIFHDDEQRLYSGNFLTSIVRVAQNLMNIGIKPNDVAGVVCMNSNATTIFINACILIGVPPNPIDPMFTVDDVCNMFSQTKPKLVLCDYDVYLTVKKALKRMNCGTMIYTNGKVAGAKSFDELLTPTGVEDAFVVPTFDEPVDEKVVAIVCSSGTSGSSKGVSVSNAFLLLFFDFYANSPPTTSLTFSTTYWSSGFYPCATTGFPHKEVRIVTNQRFSIGLLTELAVKYSVNSLFVPPTQLIEIIKSEKFASCDHSLNSIMTAGSMVSPSVRENFKMKFPNIRLTVAYGMTECACSIPMGETKPTSVGNVFMPNHAFKVVDDDGNRLGVDCAGELRIKSPIKFLGYYGNPKATEDAFDEENFFKTGDIVYFDEDHHLHIIDRKKEILKYKNYQYNPSEIEAVIEMIEGVKFVSVVGFHHEASDLATAVIIKEPGFEKTVSEDFIVKFVEAKMPIHKQLHGGVMFVDELPMTPSGKILKRKVRELISAKRIVE